MPQVLISLLRYSHAVSDRKPAVMTAWNEPRVACEFLRRLEAVKVSCFRYQADCRNSVNSGNALELFYSITDFPVTLKFPELRIQMVKPLNLT